MITTLIDSNVLIDIATKYSEWSEWSAEMLESVAEESGLAINALIYAEVSLSYEKIEELEKALPAELFTRMPLPFEAGFLAGRAFQKYRRRGGTKTSLLPDFYIGAHAAISGYRILTRDPRRYRDYFPTVELIAP